MARERISNQPEAVRARLRAQHIGLVSQSDNLFDHLSVAQNVRLASALLPGRAVSVGPLLESLGLSKRAQAFPSQLSGGETARAGLAVALAGDPRVLIADEPTGELDGETERQLLMLLRQRAADGCAVMIASHSPAVARIADRVLVLEDGRLVS